jgi:hypothetical protein
LEIFQKYVEKHFGDIENLVLNYDDSRDEIFKKCGRKTVRERIRNESK